MFIHSHPPRPEYKKILILFFQRRAFCCPPQSQVLCALWKLLLIRTQKVPLLLNLMDDLLVGMWDCPSSPLRSKKALFLEGGHAVIEVFTTRQECDGTENVGDSDAWPNRLLCTDCGVALWVAMPPFIVLQLKGSLITALRYCTVCSFWSSKPQNKDHVSKVPADTSAQLKMLFDRSLTKYSQVYSHRCPNPGSFHQTGTTTWISETFFISGHWLWCCSWGKQTEKASSLFPNTFCSSADRGSSLHCIMFMWDFQKYATLNHPFRQRFITSAHIFKHNISFFFTIYSAKHPSSEISYVKNIIH